MNIRRSVNTTTLGPTVGQIRELIDGIADDTVIDVHYDKGYNQFDRGGITFTVKEEAKSA